MTIPTITVLPTAPARTDTPAVFNTRADAFLGALYSPFSTQMNTSITAINTDIAGIDVSVTAAQLAKTQAETAESGAQTAETNAVAQVTLATNQVTLATAQVALATTQAGNSATSATAAASSYDQFDDRYLGAFATNPTTDNDGGALVTGAQYFNTASNVTRVYNGSAWQDSAALATSVTLSQVTDFPTQSGQTGKYLTTNGSVPSWATLVTDPTLGTLTQTFTNGQVSTISLTSTVLAPVVTVTKEVPQTGVTNNNWDVSSTTENYTRLDSAAATTLDWVGFDVSGASFVDSFSVGAQDYSPAELAFNTDGTKMFVVGHDTATVYEYTLSTAFDVSTATVVDGFSVSSQEATPLGLAFNTDGTKMFVVGYAGDDVNEYTLSTGFDVSTASFVDSFNVAGQDAAPVGLAFSTDGTKMFVLGSSGKDVNEYTLSTGFDVSTSSFVDSFSVNAQDTEPRGIAFNTDGTTMFIVGQTGDSVYEYALTTGFDVSTASFAASVSVSAQDVTPAGIAFSTDGMKMFVVGQYGDDVNEYTVSPTSVTLGTGSFASADVGKTIEANSGVFVLTATSGSIVVSTAATSYAQVASGSWSMYGVVYNTVDGDLELSSILADTFNVSTAVYSQAFSISGQETAARGLAFNADGTKMFVVGQTGDDVNEYALTTGFDVSTASFTDAFSVASQDTNPSGIAFNTDGTKMFVCGYTNDSVYEYTLSTGFDVSTSTYVDAFSVAGQEIVPLGLAFNTDGTKMFVCGQDSDNVNEYALTTGFDISTASFTDAFSITPQDTAPQGLGFNTDGTKMFVVGGAGLDINQYALSTGFDVSTSVFTAVFSVSAQEAAPADVAFNTDGTKMFVLGRDGADVNEYTVGTEAYTSGYQPVHTTASIDSTYWTDINSMTADQAAGDGNVYYAISTDDRTTWSVIKDVGGERDIVKNNGGTWQYNSNGTYGSETWAAGATNTELATIAEAMEGASAGFGIASAVYTQNFSVASQETSPKGVAFNADGTKMFVVGSSGDDVNEYALSTGFDVSTSTFTDAFSVASQTTNPPSVQFSTDGTKMFVVGGSNVNEYALSTGFDVSTASFTDAFDVSGQEAGPRGLAFNTDGTKMFVVGGAGVDVNEYTLSTGFDVSTSTFVDSFDVSTQEAAPYGVAFNADGTQMFIVGTTGQDVNEYTLTTGFDVSTASYASINFSVAAQDTSPMNLAFNADGSKMFIVGLVGDAIYEYSTTSYTNQMDKTQLDAVTDPNHIALGNDLDLSIILNLTSGSTVPSSNGVAINYDATVLNKGAILGTDYDFDAPATNKVRITALAANNLKVRVL